MKTVRHPLSFWSYKSKKKTLDWYGNFGYHANAIWGFMSGASVKIREGFAGLWHRGPYGTGFRNKPPMASSSFWDWSQEWNKPRARGGTEKRRENRRRQELETQIAGHFSHSCWSSGRRWFSKSTVKVSHITECRWWLVVELNEYIWMKKADFSNKRELFPVLYKVQKGLWIQKKIMKLSKLLFMYSPNCLNQTNILK